MTRPMKKKDLALSLKEAYRHEEGGISCDVMDLAKYIITKCTIDDRPVNEETLQIMLFLLQKEALEHLGMPIHHGVFHARETGPVIEEIYEHYTAMGYIRHLCSDMGEIKGKEFIDMVLDEALSMKGLGFRHASTKVGGAWYITWGKHRNEDKEIPLYLIRSKG